MAQTAQLTRILVGLTTTLVVFSALAAAQDTPTFPSSTPVVPTTGDINNAVSKFNPFSSTSGFTVPSVVGAVLNIVIGTLFTFFGIKLFRTVLFLGGALFGGYLAFVLLTNFEPDGGYQLAISREAFYGIIVIISGLVGGALSVALWRLGLFLLGAISGFVLAIFLQSLKPGGLITNQVGFWVMVGILTLAGGLLAHFLENPIIIGSTAVSGSYSLFSGIDVFAKTGFGSLLSGFVNNGISNSAYVMDTKLILMIVGFAVVALIGILVQWYTHDKEHHGVGSMRNNKRPHYGYAPVAHDPKVVIVR
ncbi:hypothetical protein HDU93_003992 [Gonapodya sp. JEL0774]|nr:hypothetical protein HDU93_003992 [Gonapodya sp. JEL0774]